MHRPTVSRRRDRRNRGLTLTEAIVSSTVLGVLAFGMLSFEVGAQRSYSDQQMLAFLHDRVRQALARMSLDTSKALGVLGSELTTLWPATGNDARGIQFREIVDANPASGVVFGPTIVIAGPNTGGTLSCAGVVRLREDGLHTDLSPITFAAGPDGVFGTFDDLTSQVSSDGGGRIVEVLVPATLAPSSGPMLRVDLNGRVVTFTLRVNFRRGNGTWLLGGATPHDLEVTERVALRR